jgi:hypothetical protein
MKRLLNIGILSIIILSSLVVLDFQYKSLEELSDRVFSKELNLIQFMHREMNIGLLTGAFLTYGTSRIGLYLAEDAGFAFGLCSPSVYIIYIKALETWRKNLLIYSFPVWLLIGSGFGILLISIESALRNFGEQVPYRESKHH